MVATINVNSINYLESQVFGHNRMSCETTNRIMFEYARKGLFGWVPSKFEK